VPLLFILPPSLGSAKATARAELLEAALHRTLDAPVSVVIAGSYGEVAERATSGNAHLVWAPAAVCAGLPAARAVFTVRRGGKCTYRSALIGRREQGLTLDSLTGTRAAWADPLSAGGYLLAMAMLRERGLDAGRTFNSQVFVGSHRAAVEAVLHGSADVTAVSVLGEDPAAIADMMRWYAGPSGDRLATLAVSEPCPNDAIVLTMALGEDRAQQLAERLVPTTPNARARSRLLSALEAEDLVHAELEAYHRLRPVLLGPSRSVPPPRSTQRPPPRSRR
jgi:ABC-type phosphate/phosphonate transport system substrate-binding protein